MKKTVLKNATSFMYRFGFLSMIIFLSACRKNSTNVIVETPEGVQVSVPFTFEKNAVFVEGGRAESASIDDMDLFGVVIESSAEGQDNYAVYANGLFTDIPDNLDLTLVPGNDYRVFAFFYDNAVDSVYDGTIENYLISDKDKTNQLFYGSNVLQALNGFEVRAGSAGYLRTISNASEESDWTRKPIINHYAASLDFQFETEFIDTLTFKQHNTRIEVDITNTDEDSRIVVALEEFVTHPISSDTTFTVDMKHLSADGDYSHVELLNDLQISVEHDYISDNENLTQPLYVGTHHLDRLEIIRVEITAPDPGTGADGNSSEFVFIEEEFIAGDTIRVGG